MRFVYSARLRRTGPDEVVVSFRDLPECLTSGADEAEALAEAADALDAAIAGRIVHPPAEGDPIRVPSARLAEEHDVAVAADTAAKAALVIALRDSGLSRSGLARRLGVDVKVVRRMLDPRHRTAASRIGAALHELGRELVVETRVAQTVRYDACGAWAHSLGRRSRELYDVAGLYQRSCRASCGMPACAHAFRHRRGVPPPAQPQTETSAWKETSPWKFASRPSMTSR